MEPGIHPSAHPSYLFPWKVALEYPSSLLQFVLGRSTRQHNARCEGRSSKLRTRLGLTRLLFRPRHFLCLASCVLSRLKRGCCSRPANGQQPATEISRSKTPASCCLLQDSRFLRHQRELIALASRDLRRRHRLKNIFGSWVCGSSEGGLFSLSSFDSDVKSGSENLFRP